MALDVGGRVALGKARRLCLRECVLVGRAFRHPGKDEVGGGVEQPAKPDRNRARESVDERAEHRRARHDGRLGAKRDAAATCQLGKLHPVQRDRPLVRGDDRDPPPQAPRGCARRPGSPSADGLAVTSTRRSASVARSPSMLLGQRRTPGSSAIDRPSEARLSADWRSRPVAVVDNPSRAFARPTTVTSMPYLPASRSRLGVERAHDPLAHRAEAHKPDPQRHQEPDGLRMRQA